MQAGETALEMPYKIDTGSEGNLMPLYMPTKQNCSYCGSSHPPRQCPAMGRSVQSAANSTTLEKSAEVGDIELPMTYNRNQINTMKILLTQGI